MGLAEMLQMYCQAKRTGSLSYSTGDQAGSLFFHHGQLVHAECQGFEGESAVYKMLQQPGGSIDFDESVLPGKRTISLTWEQLLIQSAMLADQGLDFAEMEQQKQPEASASVVQSRIAGGQPQLTLLEGDVSETAFELGGEYIHLGRVSGNDIVLPHAAVSGRHCMFMITGSDVILRDLNSSNGTFVNGEPVNETILQLGDIIQIGPVKMKFESRVRRPKLRRPVQTLPAAQDDGGRTLINPLRSLSALKRVTENVSKEQAADPTPKTAAIRNNEPYAVQDNSPSMPQQPGPIDSQVPGRNRPIVFDDLDRPKQPLQPSNLLPAVIIIASLLAAAGVVAFYFLQ